MSMWNEEDEIESSEVGSLWDIKEEKNLIPVSSDVVFTIKDVKLYNTGKDGNLLDSRKLNVKFEISDGIRQPDGTVKFKKMSLNEFIQYYANLDKYTKDWFKKGQHLVALKNLLLACGIDQNSVKLQMVKGGISDESAQILANELVGKKLLASILQKNVQALNSETGKYENTAEMANYVARFKKIPLSMAV